jgi:hypothetical protein
MKRIIINIDKAGEIKMDFENFGSSCHKLAEKVKESLGEVVSSEATSDSFEEEKIAQENIL